MTRWRYLLSGMNWPEGTRTQSFGFLMQVLARRIDNAMKAELEELELNYRFFLSLMQLLAQDGQSQRELGAKIDLPEYQVSRNLDAMAKEGLIERRPCPTSRRTTLVFLTEKGRETAQQLPAHIQKLNDRFLRSLKSDEKKKLITLLQKVYSTESLPEA